MAETKIEQLQNVPEWVEANRAFFLPPVCNKLMHGKGQLKVMFVGGPNVRKDYHIEEGEELFFQLKGHMVVKIMEKGQPKDVRIEEGEIFVLPGRIPHSPQRFENTVGLVVERERLEHERDGLRYYQPSDPTQPLWEKWFYCHDLGVQLGPVIKEYFASEAHATGQVQPGSVAEKPLVQVDTTTEVVAPISLAKWVDTHAATIGKEPLAMFSAGEIKVLAYTAAQGAYAVPADQTAKGEMWLWQYRGNSILNTAETGDIRLATGDSFLVQKGQRVTWTQEGADAVGLSVRMEPQNV